MNQEVVGGGRGGDKGGLRRYVEKSLLWEKQPPIGFWEPALGLPLPEK